MRNFIFLDIIAITLIIILTHTGIVQAAVTVNSTISVGRLPNGIAYNAANHNIYVSLQGANNVAVIDGNTNRILTNIPLAINQTLFMRCPTCYQNALLGTPTGITYDLANGNLYVAAGMLSIVNFTAPPAQRLLTGVCGTGSFDIPCSVFVIDGRTNTIISNATVGNDPQGIAYDSDSGNLYVANVGSSTVSVISGKNNTVIKSIPVGKGPTGIAYDPANGNMYVGNSFSNTVSVISGKNNTVIKSIPVGQGPTGIAYDPANGNMYVGNGLSNTVSVIEEKNNTVIKNITVGQGPTGIAYDSTHGNLYVGNGFSDTVSVIDGRNNTVIRSIPIKGPTGIAYDPANGNMYVSSSLDNSVAVISTGPIR